MLHLKCFRRSEIKVRYPSTLTKFTDNELLMKHNFKIFKIGFENLKSFEFTSFFIGRMPRVSLGWGGREEVYSLSPQPILLLHEGRS